MATIPSILARQSIEQAPPRVEMDIESATLPARSLELAGRSLMQVGDDVSGVRNNFASMEAKRNALDDSRWGRHSAHADKQYFLEWMADRENNSKEDYAEKFQEMANARVAEIAGTAPNPRARAIYEDSMMSFVQSSYASALNTSAKTRVTNALTEVDAEIQASLAEYRTAAAVPNADVESLLENSFADIGAHINTSFKEFDPDVAAKLNEHLVREFVLGTMDTNSQFARSVAQGSRDIDEGTRQYLLRQIDQAERANKSLAQEAFKNLRQDHLVAIKNGHETETLPLSWYQHYYDNETALIEKSQDDRVANIYNGANKKISEIGAWNADSQAKALNEMPDTNFVEEASREIVERHVKQSVQLQHKSTVTWLGQHNPEVMAANKRLALAQTPQQKREALTARHAAVLKYQGYPPEDLALAEERNQYLRKDDGSHNVMGLEEAEEHTHFINSGGPEEVVKRMNDIMSQYPEREHRDIAMRDLMTLPDVGKRLRQEYALAFQNRDAWWADTYVGSLKSSDAVARLDEIKRKDLLSRIYGDEQWKNFAHAMAGDFSGRAGLIEGYRDGIASYAISLMNMDKGLSMKEAVEKSTNRLLRESIGFAEVNGQTLAIPRGNRTDEEIKDMGRRLTWSLSMIDPRKVRTENWTFLSGNQSEVAGMQTLLDTIMQRGYFRTNADGESVSLYVVDESGFPMQVADKQNRPFIIYFDDVPTFMRPGFLDVPDVESPAAPPKRVDLQRYPDEAPIIDKLLGTYEKRTYWPVHPTWIRNTPK